MIRNIKTIAKEIIGKIDDDTFEYLVLRTWNNATPFVIHYYHKMKDGSDNYYWGEYLYCHKQTKALERFYEKVNSKFE